MMKFFGWLLVLNVLVTSIQAQEQWDDANNKYLVSIGDVKIETEMDDLRLVSDVLRDKKIIGLGEATHGTKEFVTVRSKLIKNLVEECDFKVLVIEDSFAMTQEVNQHLTSKDSNKFDPQIIKKWIPAWRNEEMLDLLKWIYHYNRGKNENEMIHVYGCDSQNLYAPVYKLCLGLEKVGLLTDEIISGMDILKRHDVRKKMSNPQKRKVDRSLQAVRQLFEELDTNESLGLQQLKIVALSLEQSILLLSKRGAFRSMSRNKFMSEICKKIYDIEPSNKMILWAHNFHIANKADQSAIKPMGKHLKKLFGDDYYALGMAFSNGMYRAYNPVEKRILPCPVGELDVRCVDNKFKLAPYQRFFIDISNPIIQERMPDVLKQKVWSVRGRTVYTPESDNASYRKHILSESYDGLIFIRNTSPVTNIP